MFSIIATEVEGILICGGDFNIAINHSLDTTSIRKNKRQLAKFVKLSLEEMRMIDIWRNLNTSKKERLLIIHQPMGSTRGLTASL